MTTSPGLLDLATKAFHAAQRAAHTDLDLTEASTYVQAIGDQYGGAGIGSLIKACCDQVIACVPELADHGALAPLTWHALETGKDQTADQVPPADRWAGQVINARANNDEDTWWALVTSVPREVHSDYVMTLLGLSALNVNHALARRRAAGAS